MKRYIHIKQITIEAEPMTKGEASDNNLLYGQQISNNEREEKGYLTVENGTYHSWCPSNTFHNLFSIAETPSDIIAIEGAFLNNSKKEILKITQSEEFNELDANTKALMLAQLETISQCAQTMEIRPSELTCGETERHNIPFSMAAILLKNGFSLRRSSWIPNNTFVTRQVPTHVDNTVIPNMTSLSQSAKDIILKNKGFINYNNQCIIYNVDNGQATTWTPTVEDIFSNDWEIVN